MTERKLKLRADMRNRLLVLLGVWVLYVLLSIFAPSAESVSRYGLSLTQTNLLRITVLLPLLFIWITILFCVVRFGRYAKFVKNSEEGPAFRFFTFGLWMLLFAIVIPNFINIIASYFPGSLEAQQYGTILRNYVTAGLYLAGFWYLWQASKSLLANLNIHSMSAKVRFAVIVLLGTLVAVYAWAIFQNQFRYISTDPLVKATYYLPDPAIIFTIIIPYALGWFFGTLAVLNILEYARRVQGIIYRHTFMSVAFGLAWTVILLIGLQFLSQTNAILGHAALKIVLVIIYLILLAIAVGYLLIARGAQKLTVIEEVK